MHFYDFVYPSLSLHFDINDSLIAFRCSQQVAFMLEIN